MTGHDAAGASHRGFPVEEFETRCARAQTLMVEAGLAALLLTREPELRYYTGFLTRFWESPTRPWFLVLPAKGAPIAVIPSIGAHLMGQTWISDIRTWPAPDYEDDGIGLLAEALKELVPVGERIGVAHHLESHLHMPLGAFLDCNRLWKPVASPMTPKSPPASGRSSPWPRSPRSRRQSP
jgi:Xaa-Pro aminopeptidase